MIRSLLLALLLCHTATAQNREVLRALPVPEDPQDNIAGDIASPPPGTPSQNPEPTLVRPQLPQSTPVTSQSTGTEAISPIDERPTGDDAFRLQIFLDQSFFGPGVIDGKPGQFTTLAVNSWNEVNGHPTGSWAAVNRAARHAVPHPLATATVPEAAKEWVNPSLSTRRSEQAKVKRMSYRSYAEFMSERYHTDIPTLVRLNPGKSIYGLKIADNLIVPNVEPFLVENLTDRAYNEMEDLSDRYVVVDTKINQVRIFAGTPRPNIILDPENPVATPVANTALIASFPITPGQPQFIAFGTWKLRNMVELPWWRYDQQLLDTGKRSDNALMIPPGPNSPVGVIWHGTTRSGIGLHGTSDPETIGRSRSAGCIRLCNWDAIRLPQLIRSGATIEIR